MDPCTTSSTGVHGLSRLCVVQRSVIARFRSRLRESVTAHRRVCSSDVVWDFGLVARPVSDQSNSVLVLVLILWTRSCKWHEWLCFVYCLCSIFPLLTYLTLLVNCSYSFLFTCIIALLNRSVVLVLVLWSRSCSHHWCAVYSITFSLL